MYAIRPDGTLAWRFQTGGPVESSAAIGLDGSVYFTSADGRFYALHVDGTKAWDFSTGLSSASSPAVGADGTIYFGPVGGSVFALKPGGAVLWIFDSGAGVYGASPSLSMDGRLLVPAGRTLWALSVAAGPARSPWPMFRHDSRHTGNGGQGLAFPGALSLVESDGGVAIDVYGELGQKYRLERSEDLKAWMGWMEVVLAAVHLQIADPDFGDRRALFYRAISRD